MAKKQEQETKPLEHHFKRGRALVVPSLSIAKMEEGDSLFVKFETVPVTKNQTTAKGEVKLDPESGEPLTITTAQVIDLQTGALGDLVLSYMVCKGLAMVGDAGDLVGRKFELVKGKKKNRTTMWEVYEIEG